jgi:nicotinamidase-related amidase
VGLILLDVISDFEFPDSERLLHHGQAVVPRLVALRARARNAGIPVVCVSMMISANGLQISAAC